MRNCKASLLIKQWCESRHITSLLFVTHDPGQKKQTNEALVALGKAHYFSVGRCPCPTRAGRAHWGWL